jgi:hypothetical protein
VFTAFILLVFLVGASPVILFADGAMTYGIVAIIVSLSLGVSSAAIRPGEADYLARLMRAALLFLAVPAIWMLAQLVPTPFGAGAHPVWTSAADALSAPVSGHISVDLGATLIGFVRYMTAAGIFVVAVAVSIDRTRAEWLLFCLLGVTSLLAALLLAFHIGLIHVAQPHISAALSAASVLGAIIATAATVRSIERYETRRGKAVMTRTKFARSLTSSLLAFAMCWLALMFAAPVQQTFIAGLGVVTILTVVIARRLALGPYAVGVLMTVTVIAAIAIVAADSTSSSGAPTLRFAADASPRTISMAEQMMIDNRNGTGVGTYAMLLPVYLASADANVSDRAPTTAAQVTIEMGRAAPWIFILMMLCTTGLLLRAAMRRGRDSFYASGAAGCAVALTLESFVDSTLLNTGIFIFAMAGLGLGVAQSMSRTPS